MNKAGVPHPVHPHRGVKKRLERRMQLSACVGYGRGLIIDGPCEKNFDILICPPDSPRYAGGGAVEIVPSRFE